jgi:hypothetical protein
LKFKIDSTLTEFPYFASIQINKMPLIGALIKQGLKLGTRVKLRDYTPIQHQRKELRKLLRKAEDTSFGKHYGFEKMLDSRNFVRAFQQDVPVFNYNSIFQNWWHRCLAEEENVCWPGVNYFALSFEHRNLQANTFRINDMVKALCKASIRQIITLSKYDLPARLSKKEFSGWVIHSIEPTWRHYEG